MNGVLAVCGKCEQRLGMVKRTGDLGFYQNHRHHTILGFLVKPPISRPGAKCVLTLDAYTLRSDGVWVPTERAKKLFRRGHPGRDWQTHGYRRGTERNPDGHLYRPVPTLDTLPTYVACVNCDSLNFVDQKLGAYGLALEVAPLVSVVLE